MPRFDPDHLPAELLSFAAERHLATLTTLRPDGSPHVTPVGFTFDPGPRLVRVISSAGSAKARNVASRPGGPAVVCQVDGRRWLAFEGAAVVSDQPERVTEAVRRYAGRYRPPRPRPDRVAIEIAVARILGRL